MHYCSGGGNSSTMLSLWNQFSVAMMAGSTVCDGSCPLKMVQCPVSIIHTVTRYLSCVLSNWGGGGGGGLKWCMRRICISNVSGCAAQT